MNNTPEISPEREAELNRWARSIISPGIEYIDTPLNFVRSRDAAQHVINALFEMDQYEALSVLALRYALISERRFGDISIDKDGMTDTGASGTMGIIIALLATPLEICLAAYHAVTGQPFELGAGDGERGEK